MSLHTRGYRPEPGERWNGTVIEPRRAWRVCWRNTREFGPAPGLRLGRCATACLAARTEPDPLYAAAYARQQAQIGWRVAGLQRAMGDSLAPTMERLGRELVDAFQRGQP